MLPEPGSADSQIRFGLPVTRRRCQNTLPHWDLSAVFPGLESEEFERGFGSAAAGIDHLVELFGQHQISRCDQAPLDEATVSDIKIGGQGCSISQSSASMMSQAVIGKPVGEVRAVLRRFKSMMGIEGIDPKEAK